MGPVGDGLIVGLVKSAQTGLVGCLGSRVFPTLGPGLFVPSLFFMQQDENPKQDYRKAIDLIENVRLQTNSSGRDGDVHRAAVQAVVALYNDWLTLSREVTDMKKQIEEMSNKLEAANNKPDVATSR